MRAHDARKLFRRRGSLRSLGSQAAATAIAAKSNEPPEGGSFFLHFLADYFFMKRRRVIPAMPSRPLPSSIRLLGSGVGDAGASKNANCEIPLPESE